MAAWDDAVRDATEHLAAREGDVAGALRTLSRSAAEHGLPTDRDRLQELGRSVERFRALADTWTDARIDATAAAERARVTAAQADRSHSLAEKQAADAAAAEAKAAGMRARLTAVEETVGADYRQIVARVAETRAERDRCHIRRSAGRPS
ncbi:hypothetical protein [Streptomyces sp. NPDC088707]|uniref:hypothetical protein n=1 Tax=Streptomyces sp. NPDC088707 TaxID=3365871 RepID=UPI003828ADFD